MVARLRQLPARIHLRRDENWVNEASPRTVTSLIKLLHNSAPDLRNAAATRLGQIGDPFAVPYLADLLKDQDAAVRYGSAQALGWIRDPRAILPLVEALMDPEDEVRLMAIMALGWIGDASATKGLAGILGSTNSLHLQAAIGVIRQFGSPAIPYLLEALLQSQYRGERRLIAELLCEFDRDAISALLEAISSSRKDVRKVASRALIEIGPAAIPAVVDVLIKAENPMDRTVARDTIVGMGEPGLSALIQLLLDPDCKYLSDVVIGLALIGEVAIDTLICSLSLANGSERRLILRAFKLMGEIASLRLRETLLVDDRLSKLGAIWILGELGDPANSCILVSVLNSPDAVIRWAATRALGSIADRDSIPALLNLVHDIDAAVSIEAAVALGKIGAPSVPGLVGLFANGAKEESRWAAAVGLTEVMEDAIPALLLAWRNEYRDVRLTIAETLRKVAQARVVSCLPMPLLEESNANLERGATVLPEYDNYIPTLEKVDFMTESA